MAHKQQALINVNNMIQIFVTGGTFDKEYNELNGALFFKDTHLPEMLEKGRSRLAVSIDTLLMKDSLDFNEVDRQLISFACASASVDRILITHGTDTMVQTAQYLAAQNLAKTIAHNDRQGFLHMTFCKLRFI